MREAARALHFDLLAARQIKNNSSNLLWRECPKKKWKEKNKYSNQNHRNVNMWCSVGANGIVWFRSCAKGKHGTCHTHSVNPARASLSPSHTIEFKQTRQLSFRYSSHFPYVFNWFIHFIPIGISASLLHTQLYIHVKENSSGKYFVYPNSLTHEKSDLIKYKCLQSALSPVIRTYITSLYHCERNKSKCVDSLCTCTRYTVTSTPCCSTFRSLELRFLTDFESLVPLRTEWVSCLFENWSVPHLHWNDLLCAFSKWDWEN